MSVLITVILAILLFFIMIFPHEMGHFFVAKLCKVQVNQFAIGFGPALFKKQKGETLYAVRAIPLGGYCAMEGENEESDNPRAFTNKTWWQKILVLFAGSAMNIVVCIIILMIMAMSNGVPTTTIGNVQDNTPAALAGIQAEDKILSIDGQEVEEWSDVSKILNGSEKPDQEHTFVVSRGANDTTTKITPKYSEDADRYIIGIETKLDHSFFTGVKQGFVGTWEMITNVYEAFKMLFTGDVGLDQLSGPVGIVTIVDKTNDYGINFFFYLAAFISANLALVNLFPLPALDGGRIIMVLVRQITGKKITDSMEAKIHLIGIALLLLLFVYITWNDIVRIFE